MDKLYNTMYFEKGVITHFSKNFNNNKKFSKHTNLQSFLIKTLAFLVMFLGNSIASIPFRIIL